VAGVGRATRCCVSLSPNICSLSLLWEPDGLASRCRSRWIELITALEKQVAHGAIEKLSMGGIFETNRGIPLYDLQQNGMRRRGRARAEQGTNRGGHLSTSVRVDAIRIWFGKVHARRIERVPNVNLHQWARIVSSHLGIMEGELEAGYPKGLDRLG